MAANQECTVQIWNYRSRYANPSSLGEVGCRPKTLGQLLECFPERDAQRAIRQAVARPDVYSIVEGCDEQLCVCHLKVKTFTEATSLKPGDTIIVNPAKIQKEKGLGKYTSPSPPLGSREEAAAVDNLRQVGYSIDLEEAMGEGEETPAPHMGMSGTGELLRDIAHLGKYLFHDSARSGDREVESAPRLPPCAPFEGNISSILKSSHTETTGEGSGVGGRRSPPPARRPLFTTSTPQEKKYPRTGDFIPLMGLRRPRELPSQIHSPSPDPSPAHITQECKQEQVSTGFLLRSRHPQIMPHPRLIGERPLSAVHPPHRQPHDLRRTDPSLVHFIHLNGQPVMKLEHREFYHQSLGPPATYGHRHPREVLGEIGYSQMMMQCNYHSQELVREILYAIRWMIREMDIPVYIHQIQVTMPEYKDDYLFWRNDFSEWEAYHRVHNTSVTEPVTHAHGPRERIVQEIIIKEAWTKDCITLVEAVLHEMAHVLSPCPFDTVTESNGHDPQWVNCMANLIRYLHKAPHGKWMSKMKFKMMLRGVVWSDILMVFPTRISHAPW